MIGTVYQYSDPQEICRPGERPRLATVERWARLNGIRFKYDGNGNGGVWTTEAALNEALGVLPPNDKYDPTDII